MLLPSTLLALSGSVKPLYVAQAAGNKQSHLAMPSCLPVITGVVHALNMSRSRLLLSCLAKTPKL